MLNYSSERGLTVGKHSGSGTGGIVGAPAFTGATMRSEGRWDGLGVSAPIEVPGVGSHDQPFNAALHGTQGFHDGTTNGIFVSPDITSREASSSANRYHNLNLSLRFESTGDRTQLEMQAAADLANLRFSDLAAVRAQRLLGSDDGAQLLVRNAAEAPLRGKGSLFTGEWTVPQLAGVGVGLLAAQSMLAVF